MKKILAWCKFRLEGGVGSEVCVMCLTAALAWCRTISELTYFLVFGAEGLVFNVKVSGRVSSEVCVMCWAAVLAWCRTISEFTCPRVEDSRCQLCGINVYS